MRMKILKSGLIISGIIVSIFIFSCESKVVKNSQIRENLFSSDLSNMDYEILFSSPEVKRGGSGVILLKKLNPDIKEIFLILNKNYKIPFVKYKGFLIAFFGWPLTFENINPEIVLSFDSFSITNELKIKFSERKYKVDNIKMSSNFGKEKEDEFGEKLPKDPLKRYSYIVNKLNEKRVFDVFEHTYKVKSIRDDFLFIPQKPVIDGYITSDYGVKRNFYLNNKLVRSSYHFGIDFVKGKNFEIYSIEKGRVVFSGYNGANGNYILIDHGYGIFSGYSHCSKLLVKEEEEVEKGILIAFSGKTGYVTGDHLHFSLIINGMNIDPNDWFDNEWLKHNILPAFGISENFKISKN